ncbi:hypothetical protein TNCV_1745181 [Trichonephila clavipes]|nr:hypothetical protein TNCV_1745181 [Trichonephila clavipes]
MIQICLATRGRKRLRSAISGVIHKNIKGIRPALSQSFELPSSAGKCRLGGVVGLPLAFCTQVDKLNPGPSWLVLMVQKIDSDYVA